MSGERWMVVEPLDTIIIRDGRAFDAGANSQARAVLPSPSTIAGAVGAAYGARPGAGRDRAARGSVLPERVQGPFVVSPAGEGRWETHWPLPLDVVTVRNRLRRLEPDPDPVQGACTDLSGQVGALLSDEEDCEPGQGWWDSEALTSYLRDGEVDGEPSVFWAEGDPYVPWKVERRVGLARTPERLAAEGMLYAAEHLRLAGGHGLAARCIGGPRDRSLADMVNFGGRGRRAQVHEPKQVLMPKSADTFPKGRMLLYLATPAVFPGGDWKPVLPGAELVTAAVGPPQVVTTVTASAGKVQGGLLMWAVPAGTVYYLEFADEDAARQAAEQLYDRPLEQAEDWLRTAGFGFAFAGRWSS
ncbi:type III-B CRISPR module-associated Cmr3 family protein [Nonomuraea sp. NPDC049419]|uniref:type III-B CRISPR module-associated Cmr3 family protein n=1 Tax=Nonomuraea sp. NPDC049419 TaxID=3155772 RepID=UPI00342CDD78